MQHYIDWSEKNLTKIESNKFKGLTNLKTLLLHNNEIEKIDVKLFEDLKKLQVLNLHKNKLTSIDSNTFKGLTNLEKLSLSENLIEVIDEKLFEDLKKLQVLNLHKNKLTSIDSNIFKELIELEKLSLSGNAIKNTDDISFERIEKLIELYLNGIQPNTFKELTKLEKLTLNGNIIVCIDPKLIDCLKNLKELNLHENKIKSIDTNTFKGLTNLEKLSLSENLIEVIDEKLFEGLSKLTELNLQKNKLNEIKQETFKGLTNLKTLLLHNNEIEKIDVKLFEDLKKLQVLNLHKNKLTSIDSNTFKGLTNLEKLSLSGNKLEKINVRLFKRLSMLNELKLDHNKLNIIKSNTFKGLTNLEKLSLSGNELEKINVKLFRSLSNLKKLYLNTNKLKINNSNTFKGLTKLEILLLYNNELENIYSGLFLSLSNLKVLNLHNCKLESIDSSTFENINNLETLDLSYNKIKKINISNSNLKSLYMNNNKLKTINYNTFNGLTNLKILRLNSNEIEAIDKDLFENRTNLTELNLNYNKLSQIYSNTFKGLTNLEKLSLSGNAIEKISFDNLSNLKELYLYNNKMKKIDSDTFKGLTNLEKLSLTGNSIEEIGVRSFETLSNLKKLYLYNNKLKRIDSSTLKELSQLETLLLYNNEIGEINVNSFEGLKELKDLNLHNNKLKSIDSKTFKELSNLETLNLSYNKINWIGVSSFEGLSKLKKLDLGNTILISDILSEFFSNLSNLSELDLSFNKLTIIDSSLISLKQLVKLNVSNNTIDSLGDDFFSSFTTLESINLSFNNLSKITINLTNIITEEIFIDLSSNFIKDFSNISILYETSHIEKINVNLRFNKIESITNKSLENTKGQKIKYDLIGNPLSKTFIETLDLGSDYQNIFNIKKEYDHIKNIYFKNSEIENPIFRNFKEWSNIEKFSILTGKNGIGKSSVLNYIQRTSSDMLNRINNFTKTDKITYENKEEIQDIFSKYKQFFDLLPIDIDDDLLNSESKLIIKKLYIPIIYRMHDTIRPISTEIINIKKIINKFFKFKKNRRDIFLDSQNDSNQFNQNLIEIFFLELNENNDTFDTLILNNFGNKLEILNDHLTYRGFKYKIEENNELIEFVDEKTRNRIRAKQMSPGQQLKMLFYIWEFTLIRFNLPFTFVLLLDEPDAHLHPKAVHEFVEILEKISEAGAQIIMTTHNPTTVSFANEKSIFYMKENDDNSISIHKAKSKADAIYELTENLVAVNIPFLTILVEGKDTRFYDLVRQKLVDLGSSYACQFIFKGFGGCQQIVDCLFFELEASALDRLKDEINKIVNDINKSVSILGQTIKLITEQRKLSLDHFGIIDNDNCLEICSNNTTDIKEYYSTRDKHVYNLLRHSLENYVLDPISLYFYLKYQYLNSPSSSNKTFIVDCKENSPFKILNDKLDSTKVLGIKIGEIKDPKQSKKLSDIKSVDEFIDWGIDHNDKVQILQTIVNIMGELIIDYLTQFVCFNPRLFYFKKIVNLTPLLRYIEIKNKDKNKDKEFFLLNWIDSYIKGTNQDFNQRYKLRKKFIKNDDSKTSQKENNPKLIEDIEGVFLSLKDRNDIYKKFSQIYKNLIKVMKDVIKICNLQESKYNKDLDIIDQLLSEINKYKDIKDIDISILQDFSKKNDNDILNDTTTVTKQQLKDYINFKLNLDRHLVELIKKDLKETIECHFVYKDNTEKIKIDYPKVFYCLQGHYLEETVCKMFYVKYPFSINDENEVVCFLVKEIIKEDGLFEKCGYLIPNELKEIFDQINTIKKNGLEKEQLEKLKREQEIQINNI